MWHDTEARTVRRCVRDALNCTWPLVDIGLEYCQPQLPVVDDIYLSYFFNGGNKVLSAGGVVVVGVPPSYESAVTLTIRGSLFVEPVSVTAQGQDCQRVQLSEPVQTVCYNVSVSLDRSQPYPVCDAMSQQATCQLPQLFGVDMDVIVTSGRGKERAETDLSRTYSLIVSLTSASPVITRLESADCQADQQLSLSRCPVSRTFKITVCAASDSIPFNRTVPVTLGGRAIGGCSAFSDKRPVEYCANCTVLPQYGSQLPLVLVQSYGLLSDTSAYLSFTTCSPGTALDRRAMQSGASNICAAVSCRLVHDGQQRTDGMHAVPCRYLQPSRRP